MCGICGVYDFRNAADASAVKRMADAMVHRGPDSDGYVNQGPASLGIRRLAIIDLNSGDQPLFNETRDCAAILNGAIYNFRDLRTELVGLGHSFSSNGDTEVIVHAYEEWGPDCVKRFRGMFGLAVCDWRDSSAGPTVFIARDRLGVKPLYVHQSQDRLLFASEVRAILASGLVTRELSEAGLQSYLAFGSVQEPLSLVEGITSLAPGHWMVAGPGGLQVSEYWAFPNRSLGNGEVMSSGELRSELSEATSLRLVSDVPLGVFLSGGIDSGTLTGLMAEVSPDPVRAVTVALGETGYDETALATATADNADVAHKTLLVTEDDVLNDLPMAIDAMDQPTIDGINSWYVSRETKRSGLTVALSGVGGDELFAGYDTFPRLLRMGKWGSLVKRAPSLLTRPGSALLNGRGGDQREKLAEFVRGEIPFSEPYFLVRSWFTGSRQRRLMRAAWRPETEIEPWAERALSDIRRAEGLDAVGRISLLEMRNYMLSRLLRDTDFMAMAHSLEVRTPFLDHELIEKVVPQPGDAKFDGKSPKPMLVKAVEDLLPRRVAQAPKRGFDFPWAVWLRQRLRSEVEGALTNPTALGQYLHPEAVAEVWRDFDAGKTSWSRPWGLFVLDRWLRAHLA